MSALGHMQTYAVQKACPLSRESGRGIGMSAKGHSGHFVLSIRLKRPITTPYSCGLAGTRLRWIVIAGGWPWGRGRCWRRRLFVRNVLLCDRPRVQFLEIRAADFRQFHASRVPGTSGHRFLFAPRWARSEFMPRMAAAAVNRLFDFGARHAVEQFCAISRTLTGSGPLTRRQLRFKCEAGDPAQPHDQRAIVCSCERMDPKGHF